MDRYWVTYNEAGVNSYYRSGYIKLWINKNPGQTDTDPYYPVLEAYQCMRSFWNLITEMPNAHIEIKE